MTGKVPSRGDLARQRGPAPGSSAEWLAQAVAWVDTQLEAAGIRRTDDVELLHARQSGTVLSAATTEGIVWFKATAARVPIEVRLYQLLPALAPAHVLTPIAVDAARGWILLPDAGRPLSSWYHPRDAIDACIRILPRYAQLQRDLAPQLDRLQTVDVTNMRPSLIPQRFTRVVQLVDEYVTQQGTPAERASYERISGLGDDVRRWCDHLNAMPIGASLDHGDLRPTNILLPQPGAFDQATFIDWTFCVLTHPFVSMAFPVNSLQQHRRQGPLRDAQIHRLKEAYLEPFTDLAPRSELTLALEAACQVGKVIRALSLISLTGGTVAGRRGALLWLSLLPGGPQSARM